MYKFVKWNDLTVRIDIVKKYNSKYENHNIIVLSARCCAGGHDNRKPVGFIINDHRMKLSALSFHVLLFFLTLLTYLAIEL